MRADPAGVMSRVLVCIGHTVGHGHVLRLHVPSPRVHRFAPTLALPALLLRLSVCAKRLAAETLGVALLPDGTAERPRAAAAPRLVDRREERRGRMDPAQGQGPEARPAIGPHDQLRAGEGHPLRRLRRGRGHLRGLQRHVYHPHRRRLPLGESRRDGRPAARAVAPHGDDAARQQLDLRLRRAVQGEAVQRLVPVRRRPPRVVRQGDRRQPAPPALAPHGVPRRV
eukprot:6051733-Prymnesium_polylepis.1